MTAPGYVIEAMESIQNSTILCPDTLHQMALTDYINLAVENDTLKPYLSEICSMYRNAAERTVSAVRKNLGFPVLEPEGGLYTCMKIGSDGGRFVDKILKETGVLLIPGWGFGRTVKNAVRISYGPLVNNLDKIDEGFERVASCLKE